MNIAPPGHSCSPPTPQGGGPVRDTTPIQTAAPVQPTTPGAGPVSAPSHQLGGGPAGSVAGVSNLPISDNVRAQLGELVTKLSQLVQLLQTQFTGGGPAQHSMPATMPMASNPKVTSGGGANDAQTQALTHQAQQTIAQAQQYLASGSTAASGGGASAPQAAPVANYGGLLLAETRGGGPIDPLTGVSSGGSLINFEVRTDAQRQEALAALNPTPAAAPATGTPTAAGTPAQ